MVAAAPTATANAASVQASRPKPACPPFGAKVQRRRRKTPEEALQVDEGEELEP